jgi:hypothetical protein
MLVKQLVSLIDRHETSRLLIFPTNGQLGIRNGNFITLDLNDDRLQQILDDQINSIFVFNGLLSITI